MRLHEGKDVTVDHEPGSRVVVVRCGPECDLSPPSAAAVHAAIDPIVRALGPIDIHCDATHVAAADLRLALSWVEFLRKHRGAARLVVYHVPSAVVALLHIVLATAPVAVHVAGSEEEAREATRERFSAPIGPSPS